MGSHAGEAEQVRHIKNQGHLATTLDANILTHHLQRAPVQKSLSASQDSSDETLRPKMLMEADDCENYDKTRLQRKHMETDEAECHTKQWGCDIYNKKTRVPSSVTYTGVEQQLLQTVVPAQVLQSNQTTTTSGNFCQASAGARLRNDTEAFEVSGNFRSNKFDVQEEMLSEATCFVGQGTGTAQYAQHECNHPVEACDCNLISSSDMLNLEEDCDCKIFKDERHQPKKLINVDPEEDVEMRINKQIEKSIADILSEII